MNLIIVESPTKAKTIKGFIGKSYRVESSYGHIRDLPKSKFGIDVEHDFEPQYVIPTKSRKTVKALKKIADDSDTVILATDEDREGEAIAWHLTHALKLEQEKTKRIAFHEITEKALREALKKPRSIDVNLVNAQQARRILDRLVGYELSPFLWEKIRSGLSAGRVQSAALRMIVDREREILDFKPEEYWTIEAELQALKAGAKPFKANLTKINEKTLGKFDVKTKKEAEKIVGDLKKALCKVVKVEIKEIKRNPLPPFTTSTLQQTASLRLGFSTKHTMMLAQSLYENGYITYMRTDSLNLSEESLANAHKFIKENFGEKYSETRRFKTKSKLAQEAHEAIRPTNPALTPEKLGKKTDERQAKLYKLIWSRFLASQMSSALFDAAAIEVSATGDKRQGTNYILRASGSVLKFDGFLKIYPMKYQEAELPDVRQGENVAIISVTPVQHFTEPPPRYSEAALIKALEENGIGRPSTYAPTISTIVERGYVEKNEQRRLAPTEIGTLVNDILVKHFPEIVDLQFTAKIEKELDEIAAGQKEWVPVIREFYTPFKKHLAQKYEEVEKHVEKTDKTCPECENPMVIRYGRFGKFYACSRYPECKHTEPLEEDKEIMKKYKGEKCEKCGGDTVVKRGRYGAFLACSNYPVCKNVKRIEKTTDLKCPKCGMGEVVQRRSKKGRTFYGCNRWPDCDYATWQYPDANSKGQETRDKDKKDK